jgi:hypothetical protein
MKHYTLCSTVLIGPNTMFSQIGKLYTPFLALHQFLPMLGSSGGKTFLQNLRWWPFKIKKKIMSSAPTLQLYLSIDTNFDSLKI